MLLKDFIAKYNGQWLDFDGVYGAQCVDVSRAWNASLGYAPRHGNGIDWINLAGNDYTQIRYKPGLIPQEGDIFSMNNTSLGHTGVVISGDANGFTSFDQNWNNKPCSVTRHSYSQVQGWIRPKNYQLGGDMVTKQILEAVTNAYLNRNPNDVEYARDVGKPIWDALVLYANSQERKDYLKAIEDNKNAVNDLRVITINQTAEIDLLDRQLKDHDKTITDQEATIAKLEAKVKELATQPEKPSLKPSQPPKDPYQPIDWNFDWAEQLWKIIKNWFKKYVKD